MEFVAMHAAQSAISTLLRKLGDVVAERYTLLGGVSDEIQELKDELKSMAACFRDVANDFDDENQKEQMRTWMKQVREVGYDAEDCIDIFWRHLSQHTSGGDSSTRLAKWTHKAAILLRTLKIRNKLATKIKTLKSRAQKVSDRRLRYKLDVTEMVKQQPSPSPAAEVGHSSRQQPLLITPPHNEVYGADNKKRVVDFLNETGHMSLRVMSIVGSAGLGKTTLALSALNSPQVDAFERSAIVSVSQSYNVWALLEDIVRQLHRSPTGQPDPGFQEIEACKSQEQARQLTHKCYRHLENKRYLVVLDDVWNSTVWQFLKGSFPHENERYSRIIITTRNDEVATHCSSSSADVHNMAPLSEQDSRKLLFKTVFGSETIPSTYNADEIRNLEPVCYAILKKCGGLPLAIVSIGGMLARRKNGPVGDWNKIVDRLPSELEKGKNLDAMRRIISLSYNDMPYHLKACFLYLSVFPEDYDIRRGPLIRRWEAEGFIKEVQGLSLEEIAKDYFDEFVSRSVVTHEQLSSNSEFRSFRVHDIMLDIITVKSIQENLVSFLGNRKYNTGGHDKIRRLSLIHSGSEERYFSKGASIRHVRSLTIMGSTQKPKDITFSKLKLLRVLDLEGCQWSLSDKDWEEICKLSLLRYLSLRRTATERLPNKLGKLKALVTLDVRQTKVTHFPECITQLQNLQYLLAGAYVHYTRTHSVKHFDYRNKEVVKIPSGLSAMKALKRISFVDVNGGLQALQEVAKLSQLTRLSVIQTNSTETSWGSFGDTLSELSNSLRYLSVMQDELEQDQGGNEEPAPLTSCFCCGCSKQAAQSQASRPELAGQDQGGNELPRQLKFLDTKKLLEPPPIFLHSLHLLGRIRSLPRWVKMLSGLASLSLRHTCIADISVLERLPSLVSLKLYSEAFTGPKLCLSEGHFPVLKQLVIDNLPNLVELKFEGDGAKNLERLTLYLPNKDTIIHGIQGLKKLKTVELFGNNHPEVVTQVTDQAANNKKPPIVTTDERS